jgi:hypothetical protein
MSIEKASVPKPMRSPAAISRDRREAAAGEHAQRVERHGHVPLGGDRDLVVVEEHHVRPDHP